MINLAHTSVKVGVGQIHISLQILAKTVPVEVERCLQATEKAMIEVKRVHYG